MPDRRRFVRSTLLVGAPTLAGIATIALAVSSIPLGRLGEWVWNRSPQWPPATHFFLPILTFVLYLTFVLWGKYRLERGGEWQCFLLLPLLLALGASWQWAVLDLPTPPLGMERWPPSVYYPATSGYYTVARSVRDPAQFLANYDEWIQSQDNFHIGTHPPGLILVIRELLHHFSTYPEHAFSVIDHLPSRLGAGLGGLAENVRIDAAGQATIATAAIGVWVVYLLTLVPIYGLARLGGGPSASFVAASSWPLVPAGLLFIPVSDALFPLLAASIVWLMVLAPTSRFPVLAVVAGSFFWVGMLFSLAFVAILPIVFFGRAMSAWLDSKGFRRSFRGAFVFVATFVALIVASSSILGMDLPSIWRTNLAKHAGFYDQMPRTYGYWVVVNLFEYGISAGPVFTVLALLSVIFGTSRGVEQTATWIADPLGGIVIAWLATLLLLDLSGRNLSEVARLWILLMPFGCAGLARLPDLFVRKWMLCLLWGVAAAVTLSLMGAVEPLLPIQPT